MKIKTLALLLLLLCPGLVLSQTVRSVWEANSETNVIGYRVLYGTNSQRYLFTNTVVGRLNTNLVLTASNLPSGVSYWVVQAFNDAGLTSLNSYELLYTNAPPQVTPVPPSPPKGFRLSANLQAGITPAGPWTNLALINVPLPPAVDKQQFYRTRLLLEELP